MTKAGLEENKIMRAVLRRIFNSDVKNEIPRQICPTAKLDKQCPPNNDDCDECWNKYLKKNITGWN